MMKRQINTGASFLSSSCDENDDDGYAISSNKRRRTEASLFQLNEAVLEEIKQTNQSLIETVVDLASGYKLDVNANVRCSYSAVSLDHSSKQRNISLIKLHLPILLVELLLPEDYPNSSPRVLTTSSLSCSESEDISERAKLMFNLSLRKLSEPYSLREMAKTWDYCARSVLLEFAQSFGGVSFSSKYGSWETCSAAA